MTNATHDPEKVVRSYIASFADANAEYTASHVSLDFVNDHTAGLGTGCVGRSIYQERLVGFLTDMQGLSYEIEHLVVGEVVEEACEVAVFYLMRASWQGSAPFSIRGAQRLVVRDGLISHRTDYWDSAVFLSQIDPEARTALAAFGVT